METVQCTGFEPYEWYDGLVQGKVWLDQSLHYAILLAWDMQRGVKQYLIFPISDEAAQVIGSAYNGLGNWSDVVQLLTDTISTGPLYLTGDEPTSRATMELHPATNISSTRLRVKKFTLERALSEQAVRAWLD